jgi:hypothetical protein
MASGNYIKCPKCSTTYHIKAGCCPKCSNAYSKHELSAKYKKLSAETGDNLFFTRKELAYLPEILRPNEEVLAFSSGFMNGNTWLIALTDKRIIFLDKGLLYGLKQAIIDLNKVNSVAGSTGALLGKIIITDGAQTYTISNVSKGTVKPFTNKIQDAIDSLTASKTPQIQPNSSPDTDPIAMLEKLAGLKDRGILTEEEFTSK